MLGHGATGQFAIGQVSAAETITPDKWYIALSEPPRFLPRLRPGLQQFLAFDPQPFVPFGWFSGLSIPSVRTRRGLPAALQQAFAADTTVIPTSKLIEWFAPLSEPVRKLSGLLAALQQFFTAPSQLRPNPTTTAVLDALETKDVFLAGVSVFNAPASAEIGVVDTTFFAAEIGVIQTSTTGTITSVSISISII